MSHSPLSTFVPQWLRDEAGNPLVPVATDKGWANPDTGEQVVAFKKGVLKTAGFTGEQFQQNYKPNAMGSSFLDANGLKQPSVTVDSSTAFTVHWVAPTGVTVTGYTVEVSDNTTPASPVPVAGSPFAVAAGTTLEAVTGLTLGVDYLIQVSYTDANGTVDYTPIIRQTA